MTGHKKLGPFNPQVRVASRRGVIRIAFAIVVLMFGISCQPSTPFAGAYVLEDLPLRLKLELNLKADGSYQVASAARVGPLKHETGTWKAEGGDLILQPLTGDLPYPVRRLRPDAQRPGQLLWIVPGGGDSGAVTYFSFKPAK